jgi:hypothetical protein
MERSHMTRHFETLSLLWTVLNTIYWGLVYSSRGHCGVVYISGPMRGIKDYNYPLFHAVTAKLREKGYYVISPAELGEVDGWAWNDYMRRDLLVIPFCTHICMLPGWEGSKGANAEKAVADYCGVEIGFWDAATDDLQVQPPVPELGRVDVTFTIVTRDAAGNLVAAPARAAAVAYDMLDEAQQLYREFGKQPSSQTPGEPACTVTVEGPVIHSAQHTIDQGLDTTIPGIATGQQGA